jgi:hypothetical protein
MTDPAFPSDGIVESYDPSDALGWIRLDAGVRVRFGRSACTFDPAVPNRVRVVDAKPGAAGHLKAVRVEPVGERAPTCSERVLLLRQVLLRPVDACSDWALACHLQRSRGARTAHAASYAAIREELVARGRSEAVIEEMTSLAAWATETLSPQNGMVPHVVGDEDDVALAIQAAAERGLLSHDEAERMRERMQSIRARR